MICAMIPILAIVGRPNVGKSTLFNRLSKSKNSLVDDQPGLTRDRLYANIHWEGTPLTIIDTGGFDDVDDPLIHKVKEQVLKAIAEADAILFLVDGRDGLLPGDETIIDLLRRSKKKIYLAVNKIDGSEHEDLQTGFYRLGLKKIFPLSGAHGYGLKELMNEIIREWPKDAAEPDDHEEIRVAILGKPNVGKSSLVNHILGQDRLLVSEIPGTTRDSVDIL
ncbi:MAG: GTP-binding protein, partial [Dehalococcoidia bacterium]